MDAEGQHAHVLVPPDQLSLAIGREGQNVRLAARLTGWKIDIKNSQEYDQESEDSEVAELISQREEEESLQREAEQRLEAEQAARAEEDARLRELYPLPEDEEHFQDDQLSDLDNDPSDSSESDLSIDTDETESEDDESDNQGATAEAVKEEDKIISKEEGTR